MLKEQFEKMKIVEECCEPGIYKNLYFDNKCSLCFFKSNPKEYNNKVLKDKIYNPSYTSEQLEVIVSGRKIPKSCGLYTALYQLCEKEEDSLEEFIEYFLTIVNCIKTTTNYKGWKSEQAEELIGIYVEKKCGTNLKKIDWRIVHLICSGVLDWWNINIKKIGYVGYCYYSNFGNKPKLFKTRYRKELNKIKLPKLFDEDGIKSLVKMINMKPSS